MDQRIDISVDITVVVCTYNRCRFLDTCLGSLSKQICEFPFEIIVIDNNSKDNTFEVVKSYKNRIANFHYYLETKQGLGFARNRGMNEASGKIVAYIDDDANAREDWVRNIIKFFKENKTAVAVGGPYFAYSTEKIPPWFPKEYGTFSLGSKIRPLRKNEWINGTNMAFKKDVLIKKNGFNTEIGMKGNEISYGEETYLIQKIKDAKQLIYYEPNIIVDHVILPYKLSLSWILRSYYISGKSSVKALKRRFSIFSYTIRTPLYFLIFIWRFIFSRERYLKARIYRSLGPFLWQIGFYFQLIKSIRE